MRGERSQRGEPSTTKSVRTAAWDTKPRKSLLLLRPQPSTALSERQGTQTPSLAPRAPPSRLIPEREQQKVVVFLRERKQGAGQYAALNQSRRQNPSRPCECFSSLAAVARPSQSPKTTIVKVRRGAATLFVRAAVSGMIPRTG